MSKKEHLPSVPLDDYFEARPLLRHVRVMERVMDWVDEDPKTRVFHADLHCAIMDVLNEELAPNALTLALAITELENAFPEIAAMVKDDDDDGTEESSSVQDESAPPPLKIAPRVTHAHGEAFAHKWREMQTGDVWSEAFARAAVIEWPEDEEPTPAQERFQDIRDEILNRAFDAAMPAVAEEFVRVAREVLARERRRQT